MGETNNSTRSTEPRVTEADKAKVKRERAWFDSRDGHTRVHAEIWFPATPRPRGVVQIVHGMVEHIMRYDDFARYLACQGFAVVGHDHVGHGLSVESAEKLGCLPAVGGVDILVEDVDILRRKADVRLGVGASTPHFVFGHSMGSFVARSYVTRHGEGLAGTIICGTGSIPPATSRMGTRLARLLAKFKGEDARVNLLHNMGAGAYSKQIKNARTPLDWLSHNQANVDAYIADPLCGAMFSAGGYATLTALTAEVCTQASADQIPKGLPLLYVAGAEDPVGSCGKGVETAAALARDAGVSDVEVKIYEGMRHEILNEDGHETVYGDLADWLVRHLGSAGAKGGRR